MGYNTFLCGMGEGFDLMAASTLLSLKRYRGVDIQFVAVTIPAERNRTYAVLYVQIYVDFLENADGSICLYPDSEPNKIFPAKLKKHNTLLYNSSPTTRGGSSNRTISSAGQCS